MAAGGPRAVAPKVSHQTSGRGTAIGAACMATRRTPAGTSGNGEQQYEQSHHQDVQEPADMDVARVDEDGGKAFRVVLMRSNAQGRGLHRSHHLDFQCRGCWPHHSLSEPRDVANFVWKPDAFISSEHDA